MDGMTVYRYPDPLDVITSTLIGSIDPDGEAWRERELEELATVIDALPPGGRVLDVGAGHGRLAALLAGRFTSVVALEPDVARAAECSRRVATHDNVDVVAADIFVTSLEEGSFDAVVCHHVLQHVPSRSVPAMIERMHRLLAPGGTVVIVTAESEGPDEFVSLGVERGGVASGSLTEAEFDLLASGGPGALPVNRFAPSTLRRYLSGFGAVDLRSLGGDGVLRSVLAVASR